MKKTILLILILFCSLLYPSNLKNSISCDPDFQDILETIQKLPQANELILRVLEEGPIKIERDEYFPFSAYWQSSNRLICLSHTRSTSKADLLNSLLFELHNASRQADFEYLDQLAQNRKISKKKYVEKTEYIEYQNALATSALIEEGIESGIFPLDSQSYYPNTFKEHFRIQKSKGHSAFIEKMYDQMNS